ncbi:phosphatase PAP2 family protein [Cellulomonas dongxiuzhuiae]|uniref:phosphatase PAP2 family protein n=1 Tax=Cellulomonas dongxiuzhuiae TaxID=2819979 RepID=UPI001AAEF601|nr:phosphatase PAP2 family protein [Cellulomonas dongxiuzhuiae]MBO3086880.1 phosphatase PAP2 family protein [Cellulomonas dongxiuzhuiae]
MPAPRTPRRALVRAAAFGSAVVLPVIALAVAVRGGWGAVVRFDEDTVRAATDVTRASRALRWLLVAWQEAFSARWVDLLVVPAVCVWAWRRHGLRDRAVWAAGTVAVGWVLQLAAKGLVQRARPVIDDAVAHAPGWSFPSGHAANTTVVAVALTVLVWPLLGRVGRVLVPVTAGALVVLTAADRVLLGVHYPSDVLAGILLGLAIAGASYVGWRRDAPDEPPPAAPDDPRTVGPPPPDPPTP